MSGPQMVSSFQGNSRLLCSSIYVNLITDSTPCSQSLPFSHHYMGKLEGNQKAFNKALKTRVSPIKVKQNGGFVIME